GDRGKAYLDDWAPPDAVLMRKYYPGGSDEPHFDATPAVEKALSWVKTLQVRSFVGTESRLNTMFSLLRQMVFGAETDPEVRLAELRQRRSEIDAEIARVEDREVEANFRNLDRELRERIAAWHGAKGELLDDILGSRETIAGSDQGKSFQAFYDFLLSHARQEELTELIERV